MVKKAGSMEIQRCIECFVISSFEGLGSAQKHGPIALIIKGQEGKCIEFFFLSFPPALLEVKEQPRGQGLPSTWKVQSATSLENILGYK